MPDLSLPFSFPLPAPVIQKHHHYPQVNSIAIPRAAKQEIGAITRLVHTDGRVQIVNVEYNQLDPLLRASVSPEGDVPDPTTKQSPYPGE